MSADWGTDRERRPPTQGAEGGGAFEGGQPPAESGATTPAAREEDLRPGASVVGIVVGQVLGIALAIVLWAVLALPAWPGLVGFALIGIGVGTFAGGMIGAQHRSRTSG